MKQTKNKIITFIFFFASTFSISAGNERESCEDETPNKKCLAISRLYANLRIPHNQETLHKQNIVLNKLLEQAKELNNQHWIDLLQEHLAMNTLLPHHFVNINGKQQVNIHGYEKELIEKGLLNESYLD